MSSVFLSHNSKDKPWVRNLAERLIADEVRVWLDEAEINIGDSLIEKISTGIQDMRFVAVIISKNSVESSWVQKEISIAMSKEISGREVNVLPLVIDNCELPVSLSDKFYADFTDPDSFEISYSILLRTIGVKETSKAIKQQKATKPKQKNKPTPLPTDVPYKDEIKIVGIVKERTQQDREYFGLQDFYLQLSKKPSRDWEYFFDQSRSFSRHSIWRCAWIEDDCIVVKCVLDELSRYHLSDLKQYITQVNQELEKHIDEYNNNVRIQAEIEEAKTIERDKQLDNLDFN